MKIDNETDEEQKVPISNQTAYERMQTQVEQIEHLIDSNFFERHKPRIISINKSAMGNIKNKRYFQLDRIRRMKMDLLLEAGLYEEAEICALDNVADINLTRADGGFYSKNKVTQRHMVKEEKTGLANKAAGFWRKKRPATEEGED
jgi:hypothetical protein